MKNIILVCLALALMLIPATSCKEGAKYEALELVPEGINMLAGIQVSEALRNWQLYSELEGDETTEQQYDEMKESFGEETGIDLNDISNAVIFAKTSSTETMEYTGIILEGNFTDKDLIDNIEKETGSNFATEDYGGFTLYTDPVADDSVAFLNDTMIIMGTFQAVKDCIDVINGDLERETGAVLDTYDDMGNVMVKLAMMIPEEGKEALADQPEMDMMPVGLESFEDMQSLGLAADLGTQTLTISVNLDFSTSDSAVTAAESLETMIDFISMMSQDEESAAVFAGLEITTGGSRVYLDYEISLDELTEMAESFDEGFPMMPSGDFDMEWSEDFDMEWSEDDFEFPEIPEE